MSENQTVTENKKKISALQNQKWMEEFESFNSSIDDDENQKAKEKESFEKLLDTTDNQDGLVEGQIADGTVVAIGDQYITVDVGFKCEGHIPSYEFKDAEGKPQVKVGEKISVYLEKMEIENGYILLSRDKADIIRAWDEISYACDSGQIVEGTVLTRVKGGLSVDIGVKAFLPGSQIDTKPIKDLDQFVGQKLKFKIIKFNKKRGNIVLSRKAVLAHEREAQREETLKNIEEGVVIEGTIKNITDYGAFIDLGGMDGLLHITDMSWGRIKHPSELFKVGESIQVKILKYDKEKERVSLGYKQVNGNPWDEVEFKYPQGKTVKGKVVSLKDYGAFMELEEGVEGLIHVSEMSWTEKVKHPSKFLKVGEEVECKVLEVDSANKRISLGIKQLLQNPWDEIEAKFPVGTIIEEGSVKSVTDFGVFIDIGTGIDGLVHVSDISWNKKFNHPSEKFKKGEVVRTVVLGIDRANEKFSLGIKQLERDPWETIKSRYRQGQKVEGKITKVTDFGAFVELEEGVEGLIYISELSEQRVEKPSDVVDVGQEVKAEILSIDPKERRIGLSIKALSRSEERESYESYMSESNKKTSLGDALGDKLKGFLNVSDDDSGE